MDRAIYRSPSRDLNASDRTRRDQFTKRSYDRTRRRRAPRGQHQARTGSTSRRDSRPEHTRCGDLDCPSRHLRFLRKTIRGNRRATKRDQDGDEAGADLIKVALAGWNEGARPQDAPDIPFDKKLLAVAVEEA